MAAKLTHDQVLAALKELPGWALRDGKLHRDLKFNDFSQAFAFMMRVALAAEKMDHHPDWSNAWNKVSVDLTTHSAGGITQNDIALARKINEISA
jgi:4a-hydroxytetrahydrobiopterin dehydratase